MKTTLEIPDLLFRKAKLVAAERNIPFRELVSEALSEKLRPHGLDHKPWMKSFGKLRSLHNETVRVDMIIAEEFGHIAPEDLG